MAHDEDGHPEFGEYSFRDRLNHILEIRRCLATMARITLVAMTRYLTMEEYGEFSIAWQDIGALMHHLMDHMGYRGHRG